MKVAFIVALLSFAVGWSAAFAQNTAPAPSQVQPTVPVVQPMAPAAASPGDKTAVSKSCTDQANAKGLHGKDRKKFRSECKHNAGKAQ